MYRHIHHPERTDAIRYENDHYGMSPNEKQQQRYTHRMEYTDEQHSKQLEVMIPESESEMIESKSEADLLQVVPKSRDCEDNKHCPPTATSSPNEENPPSSSPLKPKKSLLESICSSLKRESAIEWDKQEDKLVIDLKEEHKDGEEDPAMESEENLVKLKEEIMSNDYHDNISGDNKSNLEDQKMRDKMTEEQLERRRKSNREAQRRRRARLKMQGHLEERHDYENHEENVVVEKERERKETVNNKRCLKNRPDSLYMSPGSYEPYSRSSYHHHSNINKEVHYHHQEKVHYVHEQYHHPSPKHSSFYPSSRHNVMEIDDGPSRKHHMYYPAEFHHLHREHSSYRYHPQISSHHSRHHHPSAHPTSRSPHHPASRSPHRFHHDNQHKQSTEDNKGMSIFFFFLNTITTLIKK